MNNSSISAAPGRPTRRRKPVRNLLLGLLLALFAVGCIDYQETIIVHRDGSVELRLYAVIADAARPLLSRRAALRDLLEIPDSDAQARRRLPEGFGMRYWVVSRGRGFHMYDIAITAPSVDALREGFGGLGEGQQFELNRLPGGRYEYTRTIQPIAAERETSSPLPFRISLPGQAEGRFEFRIEVPTRIESGNGIRVSSREMLWQTDQSAMRQRGLIMRAVIDGGPWWYRHPWAPVLLAASGLLAGIWWWRRRRRT